MGPSDTFGELSTFDRGPRDSGATTVTPAVVVSMNRVTLLEWIADHPEIAEGLMRVLARRLRCTTDAVADLVFTDVSGRLAKQLMRLAHKFGTREAGVLKLTHDLTQEELAQLVGASRETVNKTLIEFVQRGWIHLEHKTVWILDPALLARWSRRPSG